LKGNNGNRTPTLTLHTIDQLFKSATGFIRDPVRGQVTRNGLVTVLDVRPPEEFAAGHVAGALNAPLSGLEQYPEGINPDQEIVAYCRGPHCVLAFDAVVRLREKGLKATDWAGQPCPRTRP